MDRGMYQLPVKRVQNEKDSQNWTPKIITEIRGNNNNNNNNNVFI